MAVYELGITEEEFLRMSLRQLNVLISLNRNHRIGILFEVARGILPSGDKEEEIEEIDSFTEIF